MAFMSVNSFFAIASFLDPNVLRGHELVGSCWFCKPRQTLAEQKVGSKMARKSFRTLRNALVMIRARMGRCLLLPDADP